MSSAVLFAHVPVDYFEITSGMSAVECFELRDRLARMRENEARSPHGTHGYVDLRVTLRTLASDTTFKRTLHLAEIFAVKGDEFQFTAIFSGRVVSGLYNMRTRSGWFSLD